MTKEKKSRNMLDESFLFLYGRMSMLTGSESRFKNVFKDFKHNASCFNISWQKLLTLRIIGICIGISLLVVFMVIVVNFFSFDVSSNALVALLLGIGIASIVLYITLFAMVYYKFLILLHIVKRPEDKAPIF